MTSLEQRLTELKSVYAELVAQDRQSVLDLYEAVFQHRHFTGASSVLMFGGGVKKGNLYGASAPERPCLAIKNPISVTDLHATIFHAMGINPATGYELEKRPFYVTEDGKGQPVDALFS